MVKKLKFNILNLFFLIPAVCIAYYCTRFTGISNGWVMLVAGGYILLKASYVKELSFDMNMLVLGIGFIIKSMLDQHTGKAWSVPMNLAMPVLMYLFGKMIAAGRAGSDKATKQDSYIRIFATALAMAIGFFVYSKACLAVSQASEFYAIGYYVLPYISDSVVGKYTYWMLFIPALSIGLAVIFGMIDLVLVKVLDGKDKLLKCKWVIYFIPFVIAMVRLGLWYKADIRWIAFKEAIQLMFTRHWGNFNFTVMPIDTSNNMWLDYGRESGILVAAFLFIFLGMIIKDAIQLAINRNVSVCIKALLLSMFLMFNAYYFVESTAFSYKCLWYFGLMVSGMISVVKEQK